MTTILLIRHGHSVTNQKGIFTGQTDVPLSGIGLEQAALTARFVADNYAVDAVYSSDLMRAMQTAEKLGELIGKPVIKDVGLREIHGGDWEGKNVDDIAREYPGTYFLWKNDIGGCTPPNGESVGNLQKRAEEAVYKIAHENDGKTVAIFTHACFIRSLQCLYSGLPLSEMKSLKWVPNASVTEVGFCGKNAELLKVGQADHLKSLQTELNAKL